MTNKEFKRQLHKIAFRAGFNLHYHQEVERTYSVCDRAIRILVGVLAVSALCFAVARKETGDIIFAFLSMVAALILNVIPIGDWAKREGELFRLWSELFKDVAIEQNRAAQFDEDRDDPWFNERLNDLTAKEESLHAAQPAAWKKILRRCEGDQYERTFGRGIRSAQQVEESRNANRAASASEEAEAVTAGQG